MCARAPVACTLLSRREEEIQTQAEGRDEKNEKGKLHACRRGGAPPHHSLPQTSPVHTKRTPEIPRKMKTTDHLIPRMRHHVRTRPSIFSVVATHGTIVFCTPSTPQPHASSAVNTNKVKNQPLHPGRQQSPESPAVGKTGRGPFWSVVLWA